MLDRCSTTIACAISTRSPTLLRDAEVTDRAGRAIGAGATACAWFATLAHKAHDGGNKIMFIGNGGSAGIASHLAIDFSKNGGLRALAFNDPSALTCLGNDLGYENVFAKQIEFHARARRPADRDQQLGQLAEHPQRRVGGRATATARS